MTRKDGRVGKRGPQPKPPSERSEKIAISLDPEARRLLAALMRRYRAPSRSAAIQRAIREAHAAKPKS